MTGLVEQVLRGEADTCLTARHGALLLPLLLPPTYSQHMAVAQCRADAAPMRKNAIAVKEKY